MGDTEVAGLAEVSYLAAIETAGTQAYIFASNRQAEHIGASQLIVDVTEGAFNEAVDELGVHPIVVSSGLLILGASSPEPLKAMIRHVTDRAYESAPGLDITGGVAGDEVAPSTAQDAEVLLQSAFRAVREERQGTIPMSARFPTNPLTEVCETGFGPAIESVEGDDRMLGPSASARRRAKDHGWARIAKDLKPVPLVRDVNKIEQLLAEDDRWIGIIHADGNEVGKRIQNLVGSEGARTAEAFWLSYREFNQALHQATVDTVRSAAAKVIVDDKSPILPIIVGGDDVTVVAPGEISLSLAEELVKQFEVHCKKADLTDGLTMSAGIAITKPHYPFHSGYELAEQLTTSAKTLSEPGIDLHVLYDAAPSALSDIRSNLNVAGRALTAKPWTMDAMEETRTLRNSIEGISNSILHDLDRALRLPGDPTTLFRSAGERDSRVPAYEDTTAADKPATRLLDAIELAGLEG